MPTRTRKATISFSVEQYLQVQKAKKRLRLSRSAVVSEALECWFATGQEKENVRAYVEGYRKFPETEREVKVFESLASEALAAEEWKE